MPKISPKIKEWGLFFGLLGLATLIVAPGFTSPPFLDDNFQMQWMFRLESWKDLFGVDYFGLFRPAKNLIFLAASPLLPSHITGFHLVGLGCFFAATTGLHLLLRRLTGSPWRSLGCVAIWAMAPTSVSSIVWVSCANISLSIGFLCLSLLAYDKARQSQEMDDRLNGRLLLASCVLGFLAQTCYESAVVLPALALVLDGFRGRKLLSRRTALAIGLLVLVTVAYLLLRRTAGGVTNMEASRPNFSPNLSYWQLSVSAPWFLQQHLLMWLLPVGRIAFLTTYVWMKSASPLDLALAWLLLAGLILTALRLRRRLPLGAAGILWFLAASFPSGNFVPIYAGPIADYYLYFPSIGMAMVFADLARLCLSRAGFTGATGTGERRPVSWLALLVLLLLPRLAYAPFSAVWANVWNDPIELYLRSARTQRYQSIAAANAASGLLNLGQVQAARQLATKAAEEGPWNSVAWITLGECLVEENNWPASIPYFEKAAAREFNTDFMKDLVDMRLGLAKALAPGTRKESMDHYRKVLANEKSNYHVSAAYELAKLYSAANNQAMATATLERALKIHPGNPHLLAAQKRLLEAHSLPDPAEINDIARPPVTDAMSMKK